MIQKLSNFQQRFWLGLLGIFLLTLVITLSHTPPFHYLFIAAIGAVQAISLWEYYQLAGEKGIVPQARLGITVSLLYVLFHYAKSQCELEIGCLQIFAFAFVALSFIRHFATHENAIANIATTIFGFFYITIPLCFLIEINFPRDVTTSSSIWIVYLIVLTKITDMCAYFAGKTVGSRRLAPTLSPKKTKEGAIGGLIGASVVSVLFFAISQKLGYQDFFAFSWVEATILGLAISIFAQVGDLAESLLKRDANVKDSNCMPGFGGMLDIVDSLIFTAPLLFLWLKAKHLL